MAKIREPLQSSLLALGADQWQVSKVLSDLKEAEVHDHKLIVKALNMAQYNVSLAFSCIQAQLWMQSTVTLVLREGSEGIFPI